MKPSRLFAADARHKRMLASFPVFAVLGLMLVAVASAQDTPQTLGMLSGVHIQKGVGCAGCHANPKAPEPVQAVTCMGCHDVEAVAAKSASVKPTNPHTSPHYGKKADCNLCHHQHEVSENYCSTCHKFEFKVP